MIFFFFFERGNPNSSSELSNLLILGKKEWINLEDRNMVSCIAIPTTENPSQCNQDWAVYLTVPQVIPLYDICEMNTVLLCPISFYELLWCIEQRITTYLSSFTKIQHQVGKMTFSIIGSIKKKIARIPPILVGKLFKV